MSDEIAYTIRSGGHGFKVVSEHNMATESSYFSTFEEGIEWMKKDYEERHVEGIMR